MDRSTRAQDVIPDARISPEQPTSTKAGRELPTYRVTGYTVYPSGFDRVSVPERGRWVITVSDTGDGWAVRRRTLCLNYRRTWEFEPSARARSHDFLHRCRFSEQAALNRARDVIDTMVVDGFTFDEFVDEVRRDSVEKARAMLERERRAVAAAPHRDVRAMLMRNLWKMHR